jgi:hypothetical protein
MSRAPQPRLLGARVEASRYHFAPPLCEGGVLLGRLLRAALAGAPRLAAEQTSEPGPSDRREQPKKAPTDVVLVSLAPFERISCRAWL